MKSYLKTKDHSVSGEEFELMLHPELEMLITKPQPNKLDTYYESAAYISHTDANKTLVDRMYQAVKKYSLSRKVKLLEKYCDGEKSVLDFGAGTGDFLFIAKEKGWSVSGVEPNWGARKRASEKGVNLVAEIPEGHSERYGLITLWHVLEHLPDLENHIARLSELLRPGGTIIIAVPNFNSYDAKHYKEFWAAYDVPRHLWHFSQISIQKLFASSNMDVVATRPLVFDSFYVSLLSEKYKTGKANYFKAFFNGLLSNVKAWGSKEYSSLIYVIQKHV